MSATDSKLRFTSDYREDVLLNDGTRVRLRLIRADDKQALRRIMARLSPRSRMMRFFVPRSDFNQQELRYLTEVDGANHFAMLASSGGEPLGVARFIRLEPEGRAAEPSFVVIDAFQGRGLGRIMAKRLAEAARERAIDFFHAEVLPGNRAMLRLLCDLDGSVPPPDSTADPSISVTCRVDISKGPRRAAFKPARGRGDRHRSRALRSIVTMYFDRTPGPRGLRRRYAARHSPS